MNKSKEDLLEYIFNISSYEAFLNVTINSNKTTNKYELKQYYKKPNLFKQIVINPSNIKDLEIVYNENKLIIKNSNIGTTKIYENFKCINDNKLWLSAFIENCKKRNYKVLKTDKEIIIKNSKNEILYINKEKNIPSKLEIRDNNNNIKIYIEYKEIKINTINDNNIYNEICKD